MKRTLAVLIVALSVVGAVSAQGMGYGMGQPAVQAAPQTLSTIEGKLTLVQGRVAIVVKDKTYFVQLPQTLYGFIDGLKEGAAVKLEGYAMDVPLATTSFVFHATKLTIGSREYDLSQTAGYGMRGGMSGGSAAMGRSGGRGGRW